MYEEFDGKLDETQQPGRFEEFTGELDAPAPKGFGDRFMEAGANALNTVSDSVLPKVVGAALDTARGRATKPKESVLEGVKLQEPEFDAAEAIKLSNRQYAQDTDPANPKRNAPSMAAPNGRFEAIPDRGIVGTAAKSFEAFGRSSAAGGARALADAAGGVGLDETADVLSRSSTGNKRIAGAINTGISARNEISSADPSRTGLQNFTDKYAPQVLAQLPQVALTMLSGGVTLPAVLSGMSSYADARERGLTPFDATQYAVGMGGMEAIGEKVGGMGRLADAFEDALSKGFTKNAVAKLGSTALAAGVREVPSEELTYVGQVGLDNKFQVNPVDAEQFKQGVIDTAIVSAGTGGMIGGAGVLASRAIGAPEQSPADLARSKGFLVEPQVTSFADPNGPASQAGITPVVIPVSTQTRIPAGSPTDGPAGVLPAGSGGEGPVAGPGVGDPGLVDGLGRGLGSPAGEPVGRSGTTQPVPPTTPQQPAPVNPLKRTSDADLLAQVPVERDPLTVMMGNDGKGYTEGDAKLQAEMMGKRHTGASWEVESLDNGRFRVAAYVDQGVTNDAATVPNNSDVGQRPEGGQGNGGQAVSAGVQSLGAESGQRVAPSLRQATTGNPQARVDGQAKLDASRARNPSQPKVTLGEPTSQEEANVQRIVAQTKKIFGVTANVVAFSDPSPDSANGIQIGNTVFINTRGLTSNATQTAWHETHHVLQALAEDDTQQGRTNTPAQRYIEKVDAIFDSMSDAGKRAYLEKFLEPEALAGLTGQAREAKMRELLAAPKTRKEMMADFVGNRATDKKFIDDLAKADPVGFAALAKKWLATIDSLIQQLRGNGKNTESANVDRYVADLNKSRMIFREALVRLRREGALQDQGQDTADPAMQARQGVIGEVAPNPDQPVAAEFDAMEPSEKQMATRDIAKRIIQRIFDDMGLRGWGVAFSTGTFEGKENPNFVIEAAGDATPEQIDEATRAIGYVLDQKAMVSFDENNTTGENQSSFVKIELPAGISATTVSELRQHINEATGISGDTLRNGALVYGNFTGYSDNPLSDEDFRNALNDAITSFPQDIAISAKEVERFESAYIEPASRDGYLEGTRYGNGNLEQAGSQQGRDGVRRGQGRAVLERLAQEAADKLRQWIDNSASGRERGERARKLAAEQSANADSKRSGAVEYGQPGPNSVSAVGHHFSKEKRKAISSAFYGQGLKGAEATRLNGNSDIRSRIYFYVDSGNGIKPEAGVGGVKHIVKLNNLYDANADKLGILKNSIGTDASERMNNWERTIMRAGFDGYLADTGANQKFAVLVGKHDIQFQRRESISNPSDINDLGSFNLDRNDDFKFPEIDETKLDEPLTEAQAAQRLRDEFDMAQLIKAEIARELESEGFRVSGTAKLASTTERNFAEVAPKDIKKAGVMAESAYPELAYSKDPLDANVQRAFFVVDGTRYKATISSSSPKVDDGAVAKNVKKGAKGFGVGYELSGLTEQAKKDWNQRYAASADLFRRNFDLYTTVSAAARTRVLAAWRAIAQNPDAFEFASAEGASGKTVREVAQAVADKMMEGGRYKITIGSPEFNRSDSDFGMMVEDTKTGAIGSADVEFSMRDREVVMHTQDLDKGSGMGKPVYQIGQAFADKFKARINADGMLLGVNNYRRTEQMFSGALRSGNFDTMQPGVGQRIYGWNDRAKTQEQQDRNLVRVALASARNAMEILPQIKEFGYDLETGKFYLLADPTSMASEDRLKGLLRTNDARIMSLSRSTLARAAITLQAIEGNVAVPESMVDPVLYARKQGPNEMKYQENYLVPEIAGEFSDDSGNIAVMPGLVFGKDGIMRTYPSMPIRVRVGEHMRDGEEVKNQYGLQHRIENKQKDQQRRGYVSPELAGDGTAPEVERAIRDIALGIYEASTVYADGAASKVYLHAPSIERMTVLEKKRDSKGDSFWSVITSMPQTRADMMRRYKAPTTVGGITFNGERTQQAFDIKRGILNKLKEPGQSPVTSESYILDDENMLFKGSVVNSPNEKVEPKAPVQIVRSASGKLSIKRPSAPDVTANMSRKQVPRAPGLEDESWFMRQRRRFQDQFIQIRNLQDALTQRGGTVGEEQDVYGAEERMHGRTQELLNDFANNQIKPFIDKAVNLRVALDEVALYSYAMHAKERNAHISSINTKIGPSGSGMSDVEADNIIQMVRLSGDAAAFDELHQDLMGITATSRRVLLDEGLITQDEYDAWENLYDNYVPLRGFEDVDDDGNKSSLRVGRGFSTTGKESVRALGRKSKAGQILENIIRDYERAVIRSERNQVSKTFLDLALTNPDPDLWEVQPVKTTRSMNKATGLVLMKTARDTGEDTIAVKVGGQDIRVKIKDPLVLRAMKLAGKDETSQLERILADTLGVYTNLMRNTLTRYNPIFGAINAVRDAQMGLVSAYDALGVDGAKLYAKYLGSALAASFRQERGKADPANKVMDRWIMEMRFAGGTTGGYHLRDTSEITDTMRDMMLAAGAAPTTRMDAVRASRPYQAASIALNWLEIIGSTSEDAARAAAYRAAREIGKTPAESASISKNLTTNFNRKGEWGGTLNQLFLFFNAGVQGSTRVLQALKNPRVQAMMAGGTAAAMTLAFLNAGMGDDDDGQAYWDKIPDYEKERNLIFMLPPGVEMEGASKVGMNGRYIKIPMAYGLNVFAVLGNQLADTVRYAQDRTRGVSPVKSGVRIASAVFGSINPFGGSLDLTDPIQVGMAVAPTAADLGIQLAAGVNSFGRPVGPARSPFDDKPDSENYSARQAGSTSQRLAKWMNETTGGSEARSGAIDVMPGTLDNAWRNATGGLGVFLADTFVNLPSKVFSPTPPTDRDVPLWRNFYGEIDGVADMGLFYDRRADVSKEAEAAQREMKLGIQVDYSEEQLAKLALADVAQTSTKLLTALKKREIEIAADENMTRGEKMIARKEIEAKRATLAKGFNTVYNDKQKELAGKK